MKILTIAIVLIAAAVSPALAGSTVQRDAPTTSRFDMPDGRSANAITTYGNTTIFYGPDGGEIGRATVTPNSRPY